MEIGKYYKFTHFYNQEVYFQVTSELLESLKNEVSIVLKNIVTKFPEVIITDSDNNTTSEGLCYKYIEVGFVVDSRFLLSKLTEVSESEFNELFNKAREVVLDLEDDIDD